MPYDLWNFLQSGGMVGVAVGCVIGALVTLALVKALT